MFILTMPEIFFHSRDVVPLMAFSEVLSIASARSKKTDICLQCFVEVNAGPDKVLLIGGEITMPRKRTETFSVLMKLDILLWVLEENLR
jgi:hypothetical protein